MATKMQQRRGTAAEWASRNPVLDSGEIGVETDTGVLKVGNGTSTWVNLKTPFLFNIGGIIKALTKDIVALTLRGNTNQAVDFFRITDVDGNILARVSKDGKWYETGSENVTTKGDLLVGTGADLRKRLAVGSDALALLADASTSTGLRWGAVGKAADVQVFTASGTWVKPVNAKWITVIVFGGGQSGFAASDGTNYTNAASGMSGARMQYDCSADMFGSSVPVTVGSGGAKVSTNGGYASGNPGGNSSFGPLRAKGGGQSTAAPGVNNPPSSGNPPGAPPMTDWLGAGGGGAGYKGGGLFNEPGASPFGTANVDRSGTGIGGDGGAGAMSTNNGINLAASAGRIPAGGGGGAAGGANSTSGDGGRGEVIVITYF